MSVSAVGYKGIYSARNVFNMADCAMWGRRDGGGNDGYALLVKHTYQNVFTRALFLKQNSRRIKIT